MVELEEYGKTEVLLIQGQQRVRRTSRHSVQVKTSGLVDRQRGESEYTRCQLLLPQLSGYGDMTLC